MKKSPWADQFGTKVRRDLDATADSEDPLNPAIPRAPLLPRDLAKMPNAALPKWSNPPGDKSFDRQTHPEQPVVSEAPRDQFDAQPPPRATPSTYESAAMPPHSDGMVREPRSAPVPSVPSDAKRESEDLQTAPRIARPRERGAGSRRVAWPVAVLILLAAAVLGGIWLSGMLH